jgi:uncharacterized membrane protein YkvA (DUF1232 family)
MMKKGRCESRVAGSERDAMFLRLFKLFKLTGREAALLWYACRNPATPRMIKIGALLLVFYVMSPIDLITDAIPVLGWLDDVTLLAFALPAILKLVPEAVLADARLATERRFSRWTFWRSKA